MAHIYFKKSNKDKLKTLIYQSMEKYDFEPIDNIVLIKYNKKIKAYIRQFTLINDDLINIIYDYTIEEIELNMKIKYYPYGRTDHLKFAIKLQYPNLFDIFYGITYILLVILYVVLMLVILNLICGMNTDLQVTKTLMLMI